MPAFKTFLFRSYRYEAASGTLSLRYAFEGGPSFEEKIVFPAPARSLTPQEAEALDKLFRLLLLFAGVSYYKAYVPETLRCEAFALDDATASFVRKVYLAGLGEFAHRNKLDLRGGLNFIAQDAPAAQTQALGLPRAYLVPVGGGKDSSVTIELLRKTGAPMALFALGPAGGVAAPIVKTMEVAGGARLVVARTLDPALFALNAAGAYNGHVPITAILSVIALATALLHGYGAVVLSNERSADAPNLCVDGFDVNHQYSKSFAFEEDLAAYLRAFIAPDLAYFSLLRPLSEAAIARRFAKLSAYHPVFRSCNAAFRQDAAARASAWCGDCPKCRFVFLALAPFMEKDKLIAIFGRNLLNEPAQIEGFKQLAGLDAHKPFECVGEVEESALLLARLAQDEIWAEEAVVKSLAPLVRMDEKKWAELFAPRGPHRVPKELRELLDAPF